MVRALAALGLPALVAAQLGGSCDPSMAQLIDMQVTNCYIEEGATRSTEQLTNDVQSFRYGGQISEAFAPGDCLSDSGHPPCRCILRDRGNGEECVHMTPRTSFAECGIALVEGIERKSGDLVEVCVPKAESRDVHVKVGNFAYMFRLISVEKRRGLAQGGLLSLSADGCVLHPLFQSSVHRYQCSVDCRVGGRVLLAALKPAHPPEDAPVQAVSLANHKGDVLASNLDQIITPVTLDDVGDALRMRVILGQPLDPGSVLENNVAPAGSTVYRVTVKCAGVPISSTSTTTTPPEIVGPPPLGTNAFELEWLLLFVLFGTIGAMIICTIGRHELVQFVDRIRGKSRTAPLAAAE